MAMDDVKYEYTKHFFDSKLMPTKIDTFALAEPNLRGYRYLRLYDRSKGGHGHKADWAALIKKGKDTSDLDTKTIPDAKKKASDWLHKYTNSSSYKRDKETCKKNYDSKVKPDFKKA